MDSLKTGALIAEARKAKNMTQRALAEALHVSDRAVSKWERGAGFPDVSLLEPLADALGLTVTELLHGEKRESPAPDEEVRFAVKEVRSKLKQRHRENMNAAAVIIFMFIFLLFFGCAFADKQGVFDEHITQELSAGIYTDGVLTDETTISIDGVIDPLYFDRDGQFSFQHFSGSVIIDCLPETENMEAWISWDRDGYVKFTLHDDERSVLAPHTAEKGSGYSYIDRNFFYMAFELADGRIISTREKYVPLLELEDYYPLELEYVSFGPRGLLDWIFNLP